MRGLGNLYLSSPPLSLWVTLVYFHPPRVTLFISTLLGWRICLAYATPGSPQGYTGMSVLWRRRRLYLGLYGDGIAACLTPMNRCPSGLHASFLSVPQLTPITVFCQSEGLTEGYRPFSILPNQRLEEFQFRTQMLAAKLFVRHVQRTHKQAEISTNQNPTYMRIAIITFILIHRLITVEALITLNWTLAGYFSSKALTSVNSRLAGELLWGELHFQ